MNTKLATKLNITFYIKYGSQMHGIKQALFKCNKNESSSQCIVGYALRATFVLVAFE